MADRTLYTYVINLLIYLQAIIAQTPLDCDFETGFCDWSLGLSSDRNWTRSHVKSTTVDTGPSTGHTLDTPNYYIYLYARDFLDDSRIIQPGKCVLECPEIDTGPDGGCFRFWYHMEGPGIGSLAFVVIEGTLSNSSEFDKNGSQGPEWNCGTFFIGANLMNVKIQITATTGANVRGDIALDDFKFYTQPCQPDFCSPGSVTIPSTTSTTSQGTASSTEPASSGTTATTPTTTASAPDDTWIIYVAIVPIAICIVGGIIAFCVFNMRKKPVRDHMYDVTGSPNEQVVENEPEEYADLDELRMDEHTGDGGYALPFDNGNLSSNNNMNHTKAPIKGYDTLDNMKMKTKSNEALVKDDDSSSVHSYVDAVPSPPNTDGFNSSLSVSNKGFLAGESDRDLRTGMSNDTLNTDTSNRRLETGRGGRRRGSPVPDYDVEDTNPPPPTCGPTSAYIRPVYEM